MNFKKLSPVLLLVAALPACGWWSPIPDQRNIDINGDYVGRLIGQDNKTALLDITLVEKDLKVTATVKSRETGETFVVTGTRSVYDASPVTVNLTADLGSGSPCAGGNSDKYSVSVTFYAYKRDSGTGSVSHSQCNSSSGQFEPISLNSGQLEITRK